MKPNKNNNSNKSTSKFYGMDQIWSPYLEHKEDDPQDLFYYAIRNELPYYWYHRFPELLGTRIRGYYHGRVILSNQNNNKWYLWEQETSKIMYLPTLILKDGDYTSIGECCLSAPTYHPHSVLLLTITNKPSFVFFRINSKRNKSRWIEMSYAHRIKRLTYDGKFVHSLTCCNRKVYALNTDGSVARFLLHVDIGVKEKEVVIKLMVCGACPFPSYRGYSHDVIEYLKGSSTELFYIRIHVEEATKKSHKVPTHVHMYKADMTIDWEERICFKDWDIGDMNDDDEPAGGEYEDEYDALEISMESWETIDDLKDAIFILDLSRDHSVSYGRVIASKLGGFIHIRCERGETIYSYHLKNDTITLFPIPSPMLPRRRRMSMSEWRRYSRRETNRIVDVDFKVERKNNNELLLRSSTDDGVNFNESHLLNAPFNILETIIEFCVGVEYMNFRATCTQCHLAAPLVKWCNDTSLRRLQTYSVVSPWLMVVDKKGGVMTFTDPMLGDNYFMKKSHISIVPRGLYCLRFGWLLFESEDLNCLVFFNPFTNDTRKLPKAYYRLENFCFSAPPTSLDCMVVGFTEIEYWRVDILFVNQEQSWRTLNVDPDPHTICFSTFYGRDLYALCKEGELIVINILGKEDYSWKLVKAEAPKGFSTQYFLTNCNQHLLLVSVGGEYGGPVEVFKLNESKQEWEKIDSVGKHMIYICGVTSLCIEAKVQKMENKIFFPRLHTKNRKVVFYSLDTCKYHTFDGENVQEHVGDLFETTYHLSHNAWIEPSWC